MHIIRRINTAAIPRLTAEELKEECRRNIEELAEGGGYFLGPACEFPSGESLEKAKAMVDAAKEYGRY